jgi:uncharacterized protein (TIGR00255 family)
MQEGQRIYQWMRDGSEAGKQRATGKLGRMRAVGMTAHAIECRDERCVTVHRGGDAILVLAARPDQADLSVFDLQNPPPGCSDILLPNYCIAPHRADRLSMIISMTGFARCEAPVPGGTLACEVRSVNHRYLEPSLRLPEELRALEPELRATLQKELRRGKVDCTFTYRTGTQAARELEVDEPLMAQLAPALQKLVSATRLVDAPKQINLIDLLRYPGVVREAAIEPEALLAAGRELFSRAVEGLKAMRASEGARLQDLVQQRCLQLESLLAQVRQRLPEVQACIRNRFDERLAELAIAVDNERVEQEVALLVQRMDVAEELDRLDGHIAETRKIIASPEAAGRRLDFLMQEYNREANTLSSKSQDLATTRLAVDMKVLIEQMREQVQNIE